MVNLHQNTVSSLSMCIINIVHTNKLTDCLFKDIEHAAPCHWIKSSPVAAHKCSGYAFRFFFSLAEWVTATDKLFQHFSL